MRVSTPRADPPKDVRALWAAGKLGQPIRGDPEVVFAQVREDAAVELAALATCEQPATVFCIGSGGCAAFSLLTACPAALQAVDINPAQLYLLELKKAAFERLTYPDLLRAMTADARSVYADLRSSLSPDARAFWDRRLQLLALGLNQCGLIDRKLRRATRLVLPLLLGRGRLQRMFRQPDLASQRHFYQKQWDNWRWKLLFRWGLSRPVLRLLIGPRFLAALPTDFPRLMKQQVDTAFLDFPIAENGYLWQTFLGRYPPAEEGLPIYLQEQHHPSVRAGISRLTLACADAASWLAEQPAASISFFALSNILEVTTPDYTERLAHAVRHAARPGALVCLRFIFPPGPNDLGRHEKALCPDTALSEKLARIDRSPFCRFIQVLRVTG